MKATTPEQVFLFGWHRLLIAQLTIPEHWSAALVEIERSERTYLDARHGSDICVDAESRLPPGTPAHAAVVALARTEWGFT